MALIPLTPRKVEVSPEEALLKEMNALVLRAETDRNRHLPDIEDCYKYAMPWRHLANQSQPNTSALRQIFDTTAISVLQDFAADMLNTFTPQKNNWIEFSPPVALDKGDENQIKEQIKQMQKFVFAEMARSNLYQALQQAYLDLGVGTMNLLIKDIGATKPIHCEAIPATDALLAKGPYGMVTGIFRKKKYLRSEIKVMWPDADLSAFGAEPAGDVDPEYEVIDGCWRDWSDLGDEKYKYAVQGNGKIIHSQQWKGAGSCPFIPARWSTDPTTAWGFGPTYESIAEVRTLNHVRYTDLKNYDKYVDPVTAYMDDGVLNVDQGIEPGTWVPVAVGSEFPKAIESTAKFDVSVFERDELRSAIRRAHYQDRPEQLGKTPPTAFQWADERAERARRMGTPATNLVEELQYPIIRRFIYLLAERGTLPKVILNGEAMTLQPISPLLRAQEQEEVIRLDRFAELLTARFGPQIAMIVINVVKYAHRLAELLGIEKDLLRGEQEIVAAIQQLMPVLQSATAGRPGAIAAPDVGAIAGAV